MNTQKDTQQKDLVSEPNTTDIPDNLKVKTKPRRTAGLKAFDAILYPFLSNVAVFMVSVVATYLTSHGDKVGGGVGKWFHARGEWLTNKLTKRDMSEDQADMIKMVFFSFADGSLMAPLIKLLEDRREKIAKRLDKMFGTLPEDESVYKAEPKQTWGSVLLGRLATVSIVVPVAVALDKWKIDDTKIEINPKTGEEEEVKKNMNDFLFNDPGEKFGKKLAEKKPHWQKNRWNVDVPELFRISAFETFYTSVCTAGLYFSSRIIARLTGNKDKPEAEQPIEHKGAKPVATEDKPTNNTDEKELIGDKKFADNEKSHSNSSKANIILQQQQETESSEAITQHSI